MLDDLQAVLVLVMYLIPSIVAELRKVPSKGSVFVVNIFLGWTVIGWIVALAMAARDAPNRGREPKLNPEVHP